MAAVEELVELEMAGWDALSSTPETAREFYEDVLADEVLMLLPGGLVIDDRAAAIEAMSGTPWEAWELDSPHVVGLGERAAIVAYGVVARRDGQEYTALVSSTYVRRGLEWRLTVHQQTPR